MRAFILFFTGLILVQLQAWAQPKVVLVTGASKGIGKALVLKLAENPDQYKVYGTWNTTLPDPQDFPGVTMLKMDQTRHVDIQQTIGIIRKKESRLDVLVNNAGVGVYGPLELLTEKQIRKQFDVNVIGPLLLMKEVLPVMRENNYGRLLNVSSLAGAVGISMMDVYSGSKFALEGTCAALEGYLGVMKQADGEPWNLSCQVIEPGYTRTEFKKGAEFPEAGQIPDYFAKTYQSFEKKLEQGLSHGQDPVEVAEVIKAAIDDDSGSKAFRIQTQQGIAQYMKEKYGINLDATGASLVIRPVPSMAGK
ncbi:SDR family NAD(P)-dependent oxidoreductase [Endozoicomonas arenosclerae]|uniref:SDR family NAD(P)-dependent oxidoreductase n=1 Tax=Endozoicomonas arenosclerae TaxID=1633495 RepID=UPI0007835CBA|nr:SDR family NAD(P)-dependent oxidoreductase [Endozoicomonas arenosclerae]